MAPAASCSPRRIQAIHVVDPQTGAELARFLARIPPSRRFHFAECTRGGRWLGRHPRVLHLAPVLHAGGDVVLAVQAAGPYLGVGTRDQRVLTLKLDLTPGYGAPPS